MGSKGRTPTLGGDYEATLAAARRGDDDAWAAIYRDLAGPVLGYLRGQRAPEPEDILGEVFLQVVRDLDKFTGDEAGFRAWVFTITHRRLVDARRAGARRPAELVSSDALEVALPPASAEPDALERLSTEEVVHLLGRLTEPQRDVLLLRMVAALTTTEVAEVTGRNVEAVKALSKRGLAHLRDLLEVRGGSTPHGVPPPDPVRARSRR